MTTKATAATKNTGTEAKERQRPGPKPGAKAASDKSTAKPAAKAAAKPAAKAAAKPAVKVATQAQARAPGETEVRTASAAAGGSALPRVIGGRRLADVAIFSGVIGSGLVPQGELTLLDVDSYAATGVPLDILPTHRINLKSKDGLTTKTFHFRYDSRFKENKTIVQNEAAIKAATDKVAIDLIEAQADGANWLYHVSADTPPSVANEQQRKLALKMLANGAHGMHIPGMGRRSLMTGFEELFHTGAGNALSHIYGLTKDKEETPKAPEPTHLNLVGDEVLASGLKKFSLETFDCASIHVSIADYDLELDITGSVFGDSTTQETNSLYEVAVTVGAITWTKFLNPWKGSIILDQFDQEAVRNEIVKGVSKLKVDSSYFKADFTKADVQLRLLK